MADEGEDGGGQERRRCRPWWDEGGFGGGDGSDRRGERTPVAIARTKRADGDADALVGPTTSGRACSWATN